MMIKLQSFWDLKYKRRQQLVTPGIPLSFHPAPLTSSFFKQALITTSKKNVYKVIHIQRKYFAMI